MDNNYPPYTFLDKDGNPQGILIDQWRLWEKKTGIKVSITSMDWSAALDQMQAGDFDVIDTIFMTSAREKIYDFSKPYQEIEVPIYFNNDISGIADVESLKGFSVAVKEQDAAIDFLQQHEINNLVEYDSYESIIQAAANREVVVFVVDKPPADYFLYLYGIQDQFNSTNPLYSGAFHRAVIKGNTDLLAIVENGFQQITKTEYAAIDQRWKGSRANSGEFLRIIEIIGLISLLVLLLLVIWNRSLQSQVKRKTKTVLESEQKFRQIFETTAVGMTTLNEKGEILSGNQAILQLLGYSLEEYCSLKLQDLAHTDDISFFENGIQELLSGKKDSLSREWQRKKKKGSYIWGFTTTSLVKDTSGKPVFFIEIFEDVSQRKYNDKVRESVLKISQATLSSSNLDELFTLIHQTLSEIMPVDNFYVALYDPATNLIHFPFFIDEYEESAPPIEPGHGLSDYVIRMGKPLLITTEGFHKLIDSGEVDLIGAIPVEWLGVPLIVNDQVIGLMATQSYSPSVHFSQQDAQFLEFVSTQIAQAIEIKRGEEAQHLSEMRYRYLFEDSPVSIWEEDFSQVKQFLDTLKDKGITDIREYFSENPQELVQCLSLIKVVDVNQQALQLTRSRSKDELIQNIQTVFDPAHAADFIEEMVNIAEGKTSFEWEGLNRTLDGEAFYVTLRWAVAAGYEETLSKVIVSLVDITKRKQTEAELSASEERYRNLLDNLGEGIVIIDPQTRFLFANPSANQIFGIQSGTLIQFKLHDFLSNKMLEHANQMIQSLSSDETNTFELEITRQDGELRHIQVFAKPQMDQENRIIGTFGIIHDITDRKKAEEKRIVRSQFEEMLSNVSTRFINVDNEDIDDEIDSVLKHIGLFEKVDRTDIFRIDQQTKTMSNTHEWCREGFDPRINELQNLSLSDFPWLIDRISCEPLIIHRVIDLSEAACAEKAIFMQHGIKSMAVFPMWVNLELVGFIGFVALENEHHWDEENITMLQQFTNVITNAIERSRLLKILEDRAIRDELTGVLNRRGFLQIANIELSRAHRYNRPVGMILLDMDHLKHINDTYGHVAGDQALQKISNYCQLNLRENDVLSRWGGDEFVIMLPESNQEATLHVANRLQQSIAENPLRFADQEIMLSISAGVAFSDEKIRTLDELFRTADKALYQAKESGRNRIMTQQLVHQPPITK